MGGSPPEPEVNFFVPAPLVSLSHPTGTQNQSGTKHFAAFGADADDEFPLVDIGQCIADSAMAARRIASQSTKSRPSVSFDTAGL